MWEEESEEEEEEDRAVKSFSSACQKRLFPPSLRKVPSFFWVSGTLAQMVEMTSDVCAPHLHPSGPSQALSRRSASP